jgi:hypothetical protein
VCSIRRSISRLLTPHDVDFGLAAHRLALRADVLAAVGREQAEAAVGMILVVLMRVIGDHHA